MEFATKCIHEIGAADATGSITPAIYLSSTFAHPKLGDTTGFNYTRESNPTRARLKQLLAALENGVDALAFSSGMAAVDAVMNLFAPGDHIIISTVAPSVCSATSTPKTAYSSPLCILLNWKKLKLPLSPYQSHLFGNTDQPHNGNQ